MQMRACTKMDRKSKDGQKKHSCLTTVLFLQSKTSGRRKMLNIFEKSVRHKLNGTTSLRSPRLWCR